MIDTNNFDTKRLINFYKSNNISPIYNSKGVLNYISNIDNPIKIADFLKIPHVKNNNTNYLLWTLGYSLESFKKWLMYYLFADLNEDIFEKSYSLKFLNLYYSHLFLSHWILQFNWISLDINSRKVRVNYFNLKDSRVDSLQSEINCNWEINHKHFWPVFYNLISNNRNDYFITNIDSSASWYFQEEKFLNSKNESTCRNFYTYNYSSKYDINSLELKYFENINIKNEYGCTNTIHQMDYSRLINTVRYELIYLIWMFKIISNNSDFESEILKFFPNKIRIKYENVIFEKIDEFETYIKEEIN